jgi:hypothetical protein
MSSKVVAIIGSYRKGGTIDTAVEAVLEGAREKGAQTHTIYLTDQHLEFCTNCRQCTQTPGEERVKCAQQDDLESILKEIEAADAMCLARRSTTTTSRPFFAGSWRDCWALSIGPGGRMRPVRAASGNHARLCWWLRLPCRAS